MESSRSAPRSSFGRPPAAASARQARRRGMRQASAQSCQACLLLHHLQWQCTTNTLLGFGKPGRRSGWLATLIKSQQVGQRDSRLQELALAFIAISIMSRPAYWENAWKMVIMNWSCRQQAAAFGGQGIAPERASRLERRREETQHGVVRIV